MKLKSCFFVMLTLAARSAYAAPFLVCDTYPPDKPQPTEFVVTLTGTTATTSVPRVITTPAVTVTGGVSMKLDLGSLNLSGPLTAIVKARNAWGESAASPPLAFTPGSAAPPSGVRLSMGE